MTAIAYMIDVSSNNPPPSLRRLRRDGFRVIAIKATEGTHYVFGEGLKLADEAHALGFRVVFYHFARAGIPGHHQADYFLHAIRRHLRRGDWYCIDLEGQPKAAGYRAWRPGEARMVHDSFVDRVRADGPRFGALRRRLGGLTYGGPYFLRDHGVRRHYWRLWLADYARKPTFIPPGWRTWTAWQYTQTARVAGEAGAVDESHIRRPLIPLLARTGHPALRPGAHGPAVRQLQDLLNRCTRAGLTVDGKYGPKTASAVNGVKAINGWRTDGAAGGNVWRYLADYATRAAS